MHKQRSSSPLNDTAEANLIPATADSKLTSKALQSLTNRTFGDLSHRIALNQLTTIRWTLQEDLEAYQIWNLPAIGLSWRKILDFGVQRAVRAVRQSGVAVSNLGWVGGFTGQNGFGHSDVMLEAKRAIRVAGQLRASTVTVLTGPQNGHIDSHARRLACSALTELADLAGTYNVVLALQPMHLLFHRNWSFIHTLDDALEMIECIDHPAVKLAFGTYHLGNEANICSRIGEIVEHVGIVHLSDRSGTPRDENDREIPGEGNLPIREIIAAFESAGYVGWYETEVWSRDLWKMDHHDLIERCLRSQTALFSDDNSQTESEL